MELTQLPEGLRDQCPSSPGEVGVGQELGGEGQSEGLGHNSDGWRGGRGRVKKITCEEHWEGQLLPLVPSQQEPLPCIPPALPPQLYPAWLLRAVGWAKRMRLIFCQRLALPVPETSPVGCTSCLVIALRFCFKHITHLKTCCWLKLPAWTRHS